MVSINYAFKEIISKIVYYGPGLSGKTTNLQHVFKKVPQDTRGELISLATDADRTLYFDFLPVNVGNIRGFQVKFQLYTVPGQVYYNATRKLVLRGVDGLVFVADSQLDKMDDNIESLKNLEENLAEYGYKLEEMPLIIQYNKRDLPNIAPVEQLQEQLNPRNVPYFEAVATDGRGVFATLKAISKIVIEQAQKTNSNKSDSKTALVSAIESSRAKPKQEAVPALTGTPRQQTDAASEIDTKTAAQSRSEEPEPSLAENKVQELDQSKPTVEAVKSAYGELADEAADARIGAGSEIKYDKHEPEGPPKEPAIMRESETKINVVVSDTPDDVADERADEPREDIEETTEHAVLMDDTDDVANVSSSNRRHPDVLDADKLDILKTSQAEPEDEDDNIRDESDESLINDETVVADPKQTGHAFTKPQMAESKKVKGKNKTGLFGWLRKNK
jgi:signal recognition particle receptor subunit beta